MVPRGFLNGGGSGWDTDDLLPPTSAPWDLNLEGSAINPPFPSHSHKINDESKPSSFATFSGNNRRDGAPAPAVANAFLPGDGDEPGESQQLNHSQAPRGLPSPAGQAQDTTESPYIFSADEWSSFLHSLPPASVTQPSTTQSWTAFSGGEGTAQDVNFRKPMPSSARPPKMTPDPSSTRRLTAATPSKETPAGNGSQASTVDTGETASPKARSASNARKKQERTPLRRGPARSRSSQADEDLPKETSVPQVPEDSVTSGSQSGQSRSNFEFSKLDQLEQSLRTPGVIRAGQRVTLQHEQPRLPDEKGFSIQIGSELFKLSGASIMSDAPSYFSAFFIEQLQQNEDRTGGVRTLYIDRDPETFGDIARHLQGYLVTPRDGHHFVKLFADAQFYRLPRLQHQLFDSEIFVEIGNEDFRIPRDLFSAPGDNPNYFTLGFTIFFTSPGHIFPGLNPRGLLRPPAIHPPSIPGRSSQIFRDILHLLRGYSLPIRDNDHRAELLKDARYYNLRSLEQKLIPHEISYNIDRGVSEICIRIQDLKPSGVSYVGDDSSSQCSLGGWVNYARPYVDEMHHELVLEIDDESMRIDLHSMRADLHGATKARITSLFQIIANKMNLPNTIPLGLRLSGGGASSKVASPGDTPLSDDKVKIRIDSDAHITLDGVEHAVESSNWLEPLDAGVGEALESSSSSLSSAPINWPFPSEHIDPSAPNIAGARVLKRPLGSPSPLQLSKRRKRSESEDDSLIWMIRRGQWRLRVQPKVIHQERDSRGDNDDIESEPAMEIVMIAVKLDAISGQKGRNSLRKFLS